MVCNFKVRCSGSPSAVLGDALAPIHHDPLGESLVNQKLAEQLSTTPGLLKNVFALFPGTCPLLGILMGCIRVCRGEWVACVCLGGCKGGRVGRAAFLSNIRSKSWKMMRGLEVLIMSTTPLWQILYRHIGKASLCPRAYIGKHRRRKAG